MWHYKVLFPSYDVGTINASAEGVNIHTALNLIKDEMGRLKISNITCDAYIAKMKARFSGTLGLVAGWLWIDVYRWLNTSEDDE